MLLRPSLKKPLERDLNLMKPHEVSNILSKHYALMLTTCMRRVAEIIHLKPDDGRMELVLLELRLKPNGHVHRSTHGKAASIAKLEGPGGLRDCKPGQHPIFTTKSRIIKIGCFSFWRRDPILELQFPRPLRVVLSCFATQSLQIALECLRQGCLAPRLHA